MDHAQELAELQARIRILEERIQGLRTSRRVLMNLLAAQDREKRARILRLEAENRQLRKRNERWARAILERNIRIVRLEQRLASLGNP